MLKLRPLAVCLFAASFSAIFAQRPATQGEPSPPGKLVDIGGYRSHVYCVGTGSPTVVLSAGAGDFSVDWALVQPRVAQFARVCSYDRAGEAWSDAGPLPRTMRQEAYELQLALAKAGEHGPYILVGHSLGGLVMRVFAERFPGDVAGVVLVDGTSEDTTLGMNGKLVHVRLTAKDRPIPDVQTMKSSPPPPFSEEDKKEFENFRRQFGLPKIEPPYHLLPPEAQRMDLWARSQFPKAKMSDNYLPEEVQQVYLRSQQPPPPLDNKPLFVIIAGRVGPAPSNIAPEEWDRLSKGKVEQKHRFALLSYNSKVEVDEKTGHHVHLEDPDLVLNAIRTTRDAAQHHTKLPPP